MKNALITILLPIMQVMNQKEWKKIDIKWDFTNNDKNDLINTSFLALTIFPEVLKIIQDFVFVKEGGKIESFSQSGCDDYIDIPERYLLGTNADLVIFIKTVDTIENYLAFSSPCAVQKSDNRPIIGMISINKNKLTLSKAYTDYYINSFVHEVFHILAFSPSLFDKIPKSADFIEKIKINNKEIFKIKTPRMVYAAKKHFACDSIDGIELENEGFEESLNSHFEKRLFGNEIMTSQMNGNPVISLFTLGFLEDTSWYKIDYTNSQELFWGKNKGCEFFFNKKCNAKFQEYCNEQETNNCSIDYLSKSVCKKSIFTDGCFLNDYVNFKVCTRSKDFVKDFDFEKTGTFSRCFLVKKEGIQKAGCFESYCNSNKIFIKIENQELSCDFNKEIQYNDFTFKCPDKNFCDYLSVGCQKDCNGRGFCNKNGDCVCDHFFSGKNCELLKPCRNDDNFCKFYIMLQK